MPRRPSLRRPVPPGTDPAISVLFVCADNRSCSPAAHAIARAAAARTPGMRPGWLFVDSAGLAVVQRGAAADPLVVAEAARRGHPVDHRARPVHPDDFVDYDLIVAMARSEIDELRRIGGAIDQRCGRYGDVEPHQLQLLRRWDPYAMPGDEDLACPPAAGVAGAAGRLLDVLERSVPALVEHLAWLASAVRRPA